VQQRTEKVQVAQSGLGDGILVQIKV
jgi:hypothetical protein